MRGGKSRRDGVLRRVALPTWKTAEQCEADISRFIEDYHDRDCGVARYLLRRPARTLGAVIDVARLPRLTMAVDATADGCEIMRAVLDRRPVRRAFPHASVLVLPDEPGDYALGHSKQTLRRKVRKAQARGITWKKVDDEAERRRLVRLAYQVDPEEQRRNPNPEVDGMLVHPLWLAAYSRDGHPLLLAVTPIDGDWALLRCFTSIDSGPDQSLARYYLVEVLVDHLVRAGVRYLFDQRSPLRLPNGLRHYQRMIGYRIYRLRIARPTRRWAVEAVRGHTDSCARAPQATYEEIRSQERSTALSFSSHPWDDAPTDGHTTPRTADRRPVG